MRKNYIRLLEEPFQSAATQLVSGLNEPRFKPAAYINCRIQTGRKTILLRVG